MQGEIRIAVALIVRDNGDTLLVRKRGIPVYLQSGGRVEGTETPKATLAREMHEELGLKIPPSRMTPFGCFEAQAANVPDHIVVAHVFRVHLHDELITPAAEIEETVWVPINEAPALPLAPLTRDHILTLYWQMQFGEDPHDRREARTTAA
ncbi:NUDIX hydrolase [Shinella sp.]|uniref:NUDIX hydrolase n=1 Tax=Shinella sp. TaxID=1870904 RepID=UPI0039E4C731